MFFQTLSFWLLFLLYLAPILIAGIIILQKTTSIDQLELLIPAGSIFGLSIFTLFVNSFSFITPGNLAVYLAYLFLILIGIFVYKIKTKNAFSSLSSKELFFYLISVLVWAYFIFWKAGRALIGSDTNLYYSIAHSVVRGNFPPMTPWQPDLPLSYHLGVSELIGSFYLFTGLSFQFLHLVFASLFILCSVQIFIWLWGKYKDLLSFIFANLAGLVVFVSFGFFYLLLPNFPIHFPNIHKFNELIIFLRNLPTVNQSIEVYGAPINLDGLIYFIFHAFGLSIFLSVITILIHYKKNNSLITWAIVSISLLTLALVSESIFVATAPAVFVGILLIEKTQGTLLKNLKLLILLGLVTFLIILFQGGIITSVISHSNLTEQSIIVFPNKIDIKEDFTAYHYYQEISKILSVDDRWLSLLWLHVGVDLLILVNILILMKLKIEFKHSVLLLTLFIAGFTSLIAYNVLVPKFLVANGNRFLSFSFLTFSSVICFSLINIIGSFNRSKFLKKIFLTFFILWFFIPTIIPPLALLSKTRFGENMLVPKLQKSSEGIEWMRKNLPYNSRVVVLDIRAPHPSGMARALVEAGIFAPIFPAQFRAYTIEASPEYFDIAYYLSPSALQKLKIGILLLDDTFFQTLPDKRKEDLANDKYFDKIFDNSDKGKGWEKIYRVKNAYLATEEIEGAFEELINIFPQKGKTYIDNEENFNPSYLRRAIIFSLRDRNLYYLPQSGVYLNVETNINSHPPLEDSNYDYLVLGKNTEPKNICSCQTRLIWKGLNNEVYFWQTITD